MDYNTTTGRGLTRWEEGVTDGRNDVSKLYFCEAEIKDFRLYYEAYDRFRG